MLLFMKITNCTYLLILRSLIEEKIAAIEQRKNHTRRLNKRFTIEMNMHMAHMFHIATQQGSLPVEQRTATPESICQYLGVEFGKFETKPYIEAMKSEIEFSYPTEITDLIKARRVAAKAQSSTSSGQAERKSITLEPAMRPNTAPPTEAVMKSSLAPPSETTPNNMALGK